MKQIEKLRDRIWGLAWDDANKCNIELWFEINRFLFHDMNKIFELIDSGAVVQTGWRVE